MTKFKIGDRVICLAEHGVNKNIVNKVGKIINIDNTYAYPYLIQFDEWINGHSGGARGKAEHCWWLPEEKLQLKVTSKIIIYAEDNTVYAKAIKGKKCIAEEKALCNPSDEFSIFVGAQLALQRLAMKQKEKCVLSKTALQGEIVLL